MSEQRKRLGWRVEFFTGRYGLAQSLVGIDAELGYDILCRLNQPGCQPECRTSAGFGAAVSRLHFEFQEFVKGKYDSSSWRKSEYLKPLTSMSKLQALINIVQQKHHTLGTYMTNM